MLLDFAVSPLFIWSTFTEALSRELRVEVTPLSSVFSTELAAFTIGVLLGGHLADAIAPRLLALATACGVVAGLAVATLALFASEQPWLALPALFALGSQYGALSVLTPVATADAVPAARFGTTYGVVFSGWGVAGLAGPVAAALLAGYAGHQAVVGALVGVALIAWLAAGWATRPPPSTALATKA